MNMVLMFVVSLIAARFLKPEDIGVFSIAVVCINTVAVLRDLGHNSYLLQVEVLTKAKVASVLGITLTTSWVLALILFLGRDYLSNWFAMPELGSVLVILTVSFVIVPYASVLASLLQRDLKSREIAVVGLAGTLAYAVTCLVLVTHGVGAAALAWANLANIAACLAAYLYYRPEVMPWLPRLSGWRDPLDIGIGAMLGQFIQVAHQGLPDVVLGRFQGPAEVGLFSRANGLVGLFRQVMGPTVNAIALPVLARQHHADQAVAAALLKGSSYLTVAAWGLFAWVGCFSDAIVLLLYGNSWLAAAPLVPALCLAAGAKVAYQLTQPAMIAVGRPYAGAALLALGLLLRLFFILLWGRDSLQGFVWMLVVADLLTMPFQAVLAARWLGMSIRRTLKALGSSALVALGCLACGWAIKVVVDDWAVYFQVPLSLAGMVSAWVGFIFLLRHPFAQEIQLAWARLLASRKR